MNLLFLLPISSVFLCSVPEARQRHGEGQAATGWDCKLRRQGNHWMRQTNAGLKCDLSEVTSSLVRIIQPGSKGWLDYKRRINCRTLLRRVVKRPVQKIMWDSFAFRGFTYHFFKLQFNRFNFQQTKRVKKSHDVVLPPLSFTELWTFEWH